MEREGTPLNANSWIRPFSVSAIQHPSVDTCVRPWITYLSISNQGSRQFKTVGWTHMASAECEPITELWGEAPPPAGSIQGKSLWCTWKQCFILRIL